MAIEKGITEIADSEDDLMTSSPGFIPGEAADKLCAIAGIPYQERQDALHQADGLHQAFAECNASAADGLDVDRDGASSDVGASKIDQTNMILHDSSSAQEEGVNIEVGFHDRGLHSQLLLPKPKPTTGDVSDESNTMVVQASLNNESLFPRTVPFQLKYTDAQQQNPKPSELKSVEDISRDIGTDLTAGHQEQHSPASNITPARTRQGVTETNHPTVALAQSEALGANEQDSPCRSVDLEVQNGPACQSPDQATHDSLGQKPTDEEAQAAQRYSGDQYSNKNAVLTPIFRTVTTETKTEGTSTGASEDAVAGVSTASLSPSTVMQDNYGGSERREVQDLRNALHNSQMNIGTSRTTTSAKGASSTVDQEQALDKKSAEEHLAEEVALSRESADRGFDAGSPTARSATHARPHASAQPMSSPSQTPPLKTPQEITLDELKAQKTALLASLGALPAIQVLIEENSISDAESGDASDVPTETDIIAAANKIVKEHIKLLHEYNELKDVGQGLMGLIADQRGIRIVEVQEEFGIDAID